MLLRGGCRETSCCCGCCCNEARQRSSHGRRRAAHLAAGAITETLNRLQVVRKNFLLVYELLDEVIDYGAPSQSNRLRVDCECVID